MASFFEDWNALWYPSAVLKTIVLILLLFMFYIRISEMWRMEKSMTLFLCSTPVLVFQLVNVYRVENSKSDLDSTNFVFFFDSDNLEHL